MKCGKKTLDILKCGEYCFRRQKAVLHTIFSSCNFRGKNARLIALTRTDPKLDDPQVLLALPTWRYRRKITTHWVVERRWPSALSCV